MVREAQRLQQAKREMSSNSRIGDRSCLYLGCKSTTCNSFFFTKHYHYLVIFQVYDIVKIPLEP